MTNRPANRPALARKTSKRTEKARREELDQQIAFRVNGKLYAFRMGDLDSFDLMAMRMETGLSLSKLGEIMESNDGGPEIAAVFVWLARRIGGEKMLKFETVAREITLDTDLEGVDLNEVEGEVVDTDPEASGGSS